MKISFSSTVPKGTPILTFVDSEVTQLKEEKGTTVLAIGTKRKNVTHRAFIKLVRKGIQSAQQHKLKKVVVAFDDLIFPRLSTLDKGELASLAVQNMVLANYSYNRFKSKKATIVSEIIIVGKDRKSIRDGVKKGATIGNYVNVARDLSNTPGGDMTPALLAKEAVTLAKGTKVSVKVLGLTEIKKLKMGAIIGVAQGSIHEPKFIVMEYWGAGNKKDPTVLVGKGITFDTGGVNIKPSSGGMLEKMYMDMSGGGAVIATIVLAAKLGLKKNIVTLVPAAENAVSGESYRPGDVLTTMSGKTVEVLNTDAEGRLVLADALTYAERYKPKTVIDVATLTGASLTALGQHANAVLSSNDSLIETLMDAGEESGDYVWPLPLWEEYESEIIGSGTIADVANIPTSGSRYGGTINGGVFLWQFAKGYKRWAHIDMAPRMEAAPGDNLAKGSVGSPVQLLTKFLEKYV